MIKVIKFVKKEAVLFISLAAALISMIFTPPNPEYLGYVDWSTLGLLFCLMAAVQGFGSIGAFSRLAGTLTRRFHSTRSLGAALVLMCFFLAMLVTNDVSLITFVPFALEALGMAGLTRRAIPVVTMQTIAANLGSMAMPVGNPQNLFLCSRFQIPMGDFFSTLLPLTLVSLAGLTAAALCTSSDPIQVEFRDVQRLEKRGQLRVMAPLNSMQTCWPTRKQQALSVWTRTC